MYSKITYLIKQIGIRLIDVRGGIYYKRCRGRTPGRPEDIVGFAIYIVYNNLIAGRRGRRPLQSLQYIFSKIKTIKTEKNVKF